MNVDTNTLPRAQAIRAQALFLAVHAAPIISLRAEQYTQAELISRALDFEIFLKAAKDDA